METTKDIWGNIYRDFWHPIYRFIYARVRQHELAEDLTQETFLRARPYVQNLVNTNAFLKVIARHIVIDYWRKRQVLIIGLEHCEQTIESNERAVEEQIEISEQIMEINNVILSLSLPYQEVLRLRIFYGLSVKDTSLFMAKPEGTIKTMQHRALQALRRKYLQ